MPERLKDYAALMRLDRPVGTLLLLWPTLAALWIAAAGAPPWAIAAKFVLGTFIMRAAGCVVNDIADRNIDGQVLRTKNRPLARGRVSTQEALALFALLAFCALAVVLTLNITTRFWAVGGFAIATLYPFMKRWTYLPQVVLGAAFSWGIPMSFAAMAVPVGETAWLIFTASVLWIVAYDTQYAMVDRVDDLKAGVKSTAILFGQADRLMIGVLQAASWVMFTLLGVKLGFQHAYFAAVFAILGLFIYQQVLIKDRIEGQCLKAFHNNTWVGGALFAGVVLEFVFAANAAPPA